MISVNKKGFTLIELLVVIAIIGILTTIAMTSLDSARARARDARRKSDIKQFAAALEMYYLDHGEYPESGYTPSLDSCEWSFSNNRLGTWDIMQTRLAPYISTLFTDPINTTTIVYAGGYNYAYWACPSATPDCARQWYMVLYKLESKDQESPGITTCDGTYYNLRVAGLITTGDCKICD